MEPIAVLGDNVLELAPLVKGEQGHVGIRRLGLRQVPTETLPALFETLTLVQKRPHTIGSPRGSHKCAITFKKNRSLACLIVINELGLFLVID